MTTMLKRRLGDAADGSPAPKRAKPSWGEGEARIGRDRFTGLSDELLLRVLSFLSAAELVRAAPVSRRVSGLAGDPLLWRALYEAEFERGGGRVRPGGVAAGRVDWKGRYRLRHNWAAGKCVVGELTVGVGDTGAGRAQVVARVADGGVCITADAESGLCAWHLGSRTCIAHAPLPLPLPPASLPVESPAPSHPTVLVVDTGGRLAVGFADGSFALWRFDPLAGRFDPLYRHGVERAQDDDGVDDDETGDAGSGGGGGLLLALAYVHPLLLVASAAQMRLYRFADGPDGTVVGRPQVLTSLRSHTTREPLALAIRRPGAREGAREGAGAGAVVASAAYVVEVGCGGWSIGMQELRLGPDGELAGTRLAYGPRQAGPAGGPVLLRYSHPYLLAGLGDNTLVVQLCRSSGARLMVSAGVRLWGHTSGISAADVSARGTAVSVCRRGDDIRLWQLHGHARRCGGAGPVGVPMQAAAAARAGGGGGHRSGDCRNWVGVDDETVVVLTETRDRGECLEVFDFR